MTKQCTIFQTLQSLKLAARAATALAQTSGRDKKTFNFLGIPARERERMDSISQSVLSNAVAAGCLYTRLPQVEQSLFDLSGTCVATLPRTP